MQPGRAMDQPSVRIETMSREERLDLLERLWDSLSQAPADVPVTDAQRAELDHRAAELARDMTEGQALGVSWDEVARQLQARR